jgi:DNA repair protein RecN (Recombination protein N)
VLQRIRVRNYALIKDVELHFTNGLNLLTGETGAGKSLIVDALELCLGRKAYPDEIYPGETFSEIEAWFCSGTDLVIDGQTLVPAGKEFSTRRTISREGKGQIEVAGKISNISVLRKIASHLVNIHGQSEQRRLLDPSEHIVILDRFVGSEGEKLLSEVSATYSAYRTCLDQLQQLDALNQQKDIKYAELHAAIGELEQVVNEEFTEDDLLRQREILKDLASLKEYLEVSKRLLSSDKGIYAAVSKLAKMLEEASHIDARLIEHAKKAALALQELSELDVLLSEYIDVASLDSLDADEVEERLYRLDLLKRKYKTDYNGLQVLKKSFKEELQKLGELEILIYEKKKELDRLVEDLAILCGELSKLRSKAALWLEEKVNAELPLLGMKGGKLKIYMRVRDDGAITKLPNGLEVTFTERGYDVVEFMYAATSQAPVLPLWRVLSGGELSRLMLIIEALSSEAANKSTLIFDEIDTGIGGSVAIEVGRRLSELARSRQVIVISHLAQVAAFADNHILVTKGGESDLPEIQVALLSTPQERAKELARMMSGKATEKALARAAELLDEVQHLKAQ